MKVTKIPSGINNLNNIIKQHNSKKAMERKIAQENKFNEYVKQCAKSVVKEMTSYRVKVVTNDELKHDSIKAMNQYYMSANSLNSSNFAPWFLEMNK